MLTIYDGDIISERYEGIICSGKVVSVHLLTDSNHEPGIPL